MIVCRPMMRLPPALLLWASLILATVLPARASEVVYASSSEHRYLETFSRSMFELEQDLTGWWSRNFAAEAQTPTALGISLPWWVGHGVHNVVTNALNEPLTLVSSVAAGDVLNAVNAAQRLLINTSLGLGGLIDVAEMVGLKENHYDLGLALCVHGVPSGPYLFLPFIGPRTLRDGVMDYVVAYTLYVYVASILTGPSPPILLFVAAKNGLWLAEMATMKQLDVETADAILPSDPEDFDTIRESYLRRRNYRCQNLRNQVYN